MCRNFANLTAALLFTLFASAFYLATAFTPLTKEEHMSQHGKLSEEVEPFRRNLSECARQVRAAPADVDHFLKRIPQQTPHGKCFVACMLRRNAIIRDNRVDRAALMATNAAVYGEHSEVLPRLDDAITECAKSVADIFDICDFASTFNDCMHMNMEHVLDKLAVERRMQALEQTDAREDSFDADDDDAYMQMMRDEL